MRIYVTGLPGIGKTSLLRKVSSYHAGNVINFDQVLNSCPGYNKHLLNNSQELAHIASRPLTRGRYLDIISDTSTFFKLSRISADYIHEYITSIENNNGTASLKIIEISPFILAHLRIPGDIMFMYCDEEVHCQRIIQRWKFSRHEANWLLDKYYYLIDYAIARLAIKYDRYLPYDENRIIKELINCTQIET